MKIYIDFDGTLFNTDKYTEDFMNIFNEYDISKLLLDEAKEFLFSDHRLFNINIVVDYFISKYNVDSNLRNNINDLFNTSYVYSEVFDCLNQLKGMGYELYLLTYGDEIFQKTKIKASNISKYFKKIIITEKDKSKLDIDYKNSIFIDNNPVEIEKFYNSNAKIVIRIRRDSDKYKKMECNISDLIECKDFNHVVQILRGGFKSE